MFRSLFIGFLILSTLTASGAEPQAAENMNNIPSGVLHGFSGIMPGQAGKNTAGIFSACTRKAFFSCDTIDGKTSGLLSGVADKSTVPAWLEDNCRLDYQPDRAATLPEQACYHDDEVFYCVSGLSPPYYVEGV